MRRLSLLLLFLAVAATCGWPQQRLNPAAADYASNPGAPSALTPPENPFTATISAARTALGAGDLLQIEVFDTPEMTQRVRINGNGILHLALIGDVEAKGKTTEAVRNQIRDELVQGNFLKNPQVLVFVLEYAGEMVYITGEVNRPGAYSFLRSYRLLDLISVAGGLTARAGSEVTIIREDDPKTSIRVDLNDPDARKSNPEVSPGDSVQVSLSGVVYVLGNVGRPGGFVIDRRAPLTILQALSLAEGPTQTASLTNAILLHSHDPESQPVPVNLKQILRAQNEDQVLEGGDILWVGDSQTRNIGRAAIQSILATASGIAVYSSYTH